MTADPVAVFGSAAHSFAGLVRQIPAWDGPGLGDWDLRALVGHTARSLTTVCSYLGTRATHVDITTAAQYYAQINPAALGIDPAAVAERGRQAGRELGSDPAAAVQTLVARALAAVADVDDPVIEVIGGRGIRLHTYLPTRTFELAVHGLDIARATGLDYELPEQVVAAATTLAAEIAVACGQAETVLLALTGRSALPDPFTIVY